MKFNETGNYILYSLIVRYNYLIDNDIHEYNMNKFEEELKTFKTQYNIIIDKRKKLNDKVNEK